MTTITLYTSRIQLLTTEVPPSAKLKTTIERLASDSNIQPPFDFKVTNLDGDLLNVTTDRCVGMQPLTVEVVAPAIALLQDKVQQHEARLLKQDKLLCALARGSLLTCAAQILETALGQPFAETRSNQVQRDDPVVSILAEMAGMRPEGLVWRLNGVLDRRNNTAAHVSSCDMLDEQVDVNKELITPQLRAKHAWECWLVEQYTAIKAKLPDRFA